MCTDMQLLVAVRCWIGGHCVWRRCWRTGVLGLGAVAIIWASPQVVVVGGRGRGWQVSAVNLLCQWWYGRQPWHD